MDACAAQMYTKNFPAVVKVASFDHAAESLEHLGEYDLKPMLFHTDMWEGWWTQFLVCLGIDVLTMSGPCPPWSLPNRMSDITGLWSNAGLLTIESFIKGKHLRVKIILLESVSTFATHPHFPLVVKVLDLLGFQIVWSRTLDLAEVIPQVRLRYLAIISRNDFHSEKCQTGSLHEFHAWPQLAKHCLASYGVIDANDFWGDLPLLHLWKRPAFSTSLCFPSQVRTKHRN